MACSEPFAIDRHDLVDARILGVRQQDALLEVQVWNGSSVYHEEQPTVEWLDDSGSVLGTGVVFVFEEASALLPTSVRYYDPNGGIHDAIFELQDGTIDLEPSLYALPATTDFALNTRLGQEGTLSTNGISSDAMRIVMSTQDTDAYQLTTGKMRWMTVDGKGTFLERSALETDFYRADILMDRDELLENNPLDIERATLFALYVDGVGGNQWTWMDLWYTDGVRFHHENRWLEISELPQEWTSGVPLSMELQWDDGGQVMRLINPSLEVDDVEEPMCSSPVMTNGSNRFQWSWLESGQCTISDVDGTRIVLETR